MAYAHGFLSNPSFPVVTDERELDWDDLQRLPEHRGVGAGRLQRIRSVHHKIAKMMAAGCANVEIAAVVGMHQSRISILRGDPAFQELLAHYESVEEEVWQDVRERAAQLGMTAAEVIQDRLIEEPDGIGTKTLLDIMSRGLDYGGHKPAEKSVHAHLHTSSEAIRRAKEGRNEDVRVREGPVGAADDGDDAIDAEYTETESGTEVREEGSDRDREDAGNPDPAPLDSVLGL